MFKDIHRELAPLKGVADAKRSPDFLNRNYLFSISSFFTQFFKKGNRALCLAKTADLLQLLAHLLRGAIPLIDTLELIQSSDVERPLRWAAKRIKEHLLAGDCLSIYFKKGRARWQRAIYMLLKVGEEGGFLASSLQRAAELLQSQLKWKEQLRAQMVYPALLLLSSLTILALYFLLIAPLFAELLGNFEKTAQSSSFEFKSWFFCIAGTTSLFSLLLSQKVRRIAKKMTVHLAFWRPFGRERDLSLLFALLAQLLEEKGSFDQTWGLLPQLVVDEPLRIELVLAAKRMRLGQLPSQALSGVAGLGQLELHFLLIGEKTGEMAKAAQYLCEHLHKLCQKKLKVFLAILQPALLALLGLIIARIALLVLKPLGEMASFDLPQIG